MKKSLKKKEVGEKIESSDKKKIFLISDSPFATTGLGRMSRYFLKILPDYEWIVWGSLHPDFNIRKGRFYPAYNPSDFPKTKFEIISPKSFTDDQYGLEHIPAFIEQTQPDIVLTSMDYHRIAPIIEPLKRLQFKTEHKFVWINYFPMDREDYKPLEIDALRFPDINVTITKFGIDKIHEINPKIKIEQIYHPLDLAEFPEIDEEEIKEFRKKTWPAFPENVYLVGSVNRSFVRKDTARLIRIWAEFVKKHNDVVGYLHGSRVTLEGLDLTRILFENEAPKGRIAFLPENISEIDCVPQDLLNKFYRSMNLFTTVSTGEGFGYSTVEAMACKIPVVAPKNTSFVELVGNAGYLVPTNNSTFLFGQTTTMWPIVNVDDFVSQMDYVKKHPEEAQEKVQEGYNFVKEELNLEKISNQWRALINKALR